MGEIGLVGEYNVLDRLALGAGIGLNATMLNHPTQPCTGMASNSMCISPSVQEAWLRLSGAFTVRDGKIVEIDILADPVRLQYLDLTILDS